MKKVCYAIVFASLATLLAFADQTNWKFLTPFNNARFVYVTSYSGSQFSANPLPEDRRAINNVETALQKWGRYVLVYRPQQADMIIAVQSRGNEDVLAVYSRQTWKEGAYLWRGMEKGGLEKPDLPLFHKFEAAINRATGGPEVPPQQHGE